MLDFGPVEDKMQGIIKVIGVGGGGCNAVRNMNDEKIPGVTFAVCNTDSKSLAPSPVPTKILLGEGLGAGGKPEIGRSEAEKNIDDIEKLLSDGWRNGNGVGSRGGQRCQENGDADYRYCDDSLLLRKETEDYPGSEGGGRDEKERGRYPYY